MAAKITASGTAITAITSPGNCAGCNIFTFGPLIWASGGKIEPLDANDEPLVGDNIPAVLEWARMMHKEGLINPANQSENGETFAEQFGTGKVGIMGTGNFNLSLVSEQNPALFDNVGITFLPGLEPGSAASFAGGDIVTIPKGSKRVADAVDFMKFILSRRSPGRRLCQAAEPHDARRHGRQQVLHRSARRENGVGARCGPHAVHAEVLRADQLPAGSVAADAAARLLYR